jgi:parvulin-like peptidyl-prolyl isomerase
LARIEQKNTSEKYDSDDEISVNIADSNEFNEKKEMGSEALTKWPDNDSEIEDDNYHPEEKPIKIDKSKPSNEEKHNAHKMHKVIHHHKEKADEKKSESHEPHRKKHNSPKNLMKYWIIAIVIIAIIGILTVIVFMDKLIPPKPVVQTAMGTLILTVNGEPVYSSEIAKKFSYLQAQYGDSITEEFIINQTISELLLVQEANKHNLKIDNTVIDDAVNQWVAQVKDSVTTEQLDQILQQENITMEDLIQDTRDAYKKNFLIYDLLNRSVLSELDLSRYDNITVTDADILLEFQNNPDKYTQINVSHILICYNDAKQCASNRTKEDAEKLVNEIYSKLLNNIDFIELAKEYSDDNGSGPLGGELGWIAKDAQIDEIFLNKTFALKNVNQFTDPFLTIFGYHIAKLNGKMDQFDDFKTQISMQLQFKAQFNSQNEKTLAQQEAVAAYIDKLKKKAVIINYKPELTSAVETNAEIETFSMTNNEICRDATGKPIIRMYSTTSCPHCQWAGPTFDKVAKEYIADGKIVAYHWDLQAKDDLLTPQIEGVVLPTEMDVYTQFNSKGTIPTFIFGCKYYRIGTGYEQENGLPKEEAEFRAVIDSLIG